MWLIRLLLEPFLAIGAVLVVLAVFALGFAFVMAGLALLPGNPLLGWGLFIWGIGVWLKMVFNGINAMLGGPR